MLEANVCDYKDLHIERTVHSGDDFFIYVRTIILQVLVNEPIFIDMVVTINK